MPNKIWIPTTDKAAASHMVKFLRLVNATQNKSTSLMRNCISGPLPIYQAFGSQWLRISTLILINYTTVVIQKSPTTLLSGLQGVFKLHRTHRQKF